MAIGVHHRGQGLLAPRGDPWSSHGSFLEIRAADRAGYARLVPWRRSDSRSDFRGRQIELASSICSATTSSWSSPRACSVGRPRNARFDEMLERAEDLPFAKQPVIERSSGEIVGYAGVNWFDFESRRRLEFGWRLVPEARGRGLCH